MLQFIPSEIKSGRRGNMYVSHVHDEPDQYVVEYCRPVSNHTGPNVGVRWHRGTLPKYLHLDAQSFEAIGLLQGEMSKTARGTLTFANCEPVLVNRILWWFNKHFGVSTSDWWWYTRLNIQKPLDEIACLYYEQRLVSFWITKTPLCIEDARPCVVSFTKNSSHTELEDFGTVMIERGNQIFIQTVQKLVNDITHSMPNRSVEQIVPYLQGIIAAEGCVNFEIAHGHRRVFITATNEEERAIFHQCLHKLGIQTQDCKPIKDIIISRRENLLKLDALGLMKLHPAKHERFKQMIASYEEPFVANSVA